MCTNTCSHGCRTDRSRTFWTSCAHGVCEPAAVGTAGQSALEPRGLVLAADLAADAHEVRADLLRAGGRPVGANGLRALLLELVAEHRGGQRDVAAAWVVAEEGPRDLGVGRHAQVEVLLGLDMARAGKRDAEPARQRG